MESVRDTALMEEGKVKHLYLHGTVTVKRPLSTYEKINVIVSGVAIALIIVSGIIVSATKIEQNK